MNVLSLIPARGGSKGVPRKNIRNFCRPSFDFLRNSGSSKYIDCESGDRFNRRS